MRTLPHSDSLPHLLPEITMRRSDVGQNRKHLTSNMSFCSAPKPDFGATPFRIPHPTLSGRLPMPSVRYSAAGRACPVALCLTHPASRPCESYLRTCLESLAVGTGPHLPAI